MFLLKRICLDVDGVLNRLHCSLMALAGFPNFTDDQYPKGIGFEIVEAINVLAGFQKYTNSSFWNSVPRSLWATCPKSFECDLILDQAERLVGRDNIILLTSPTRDPDCVAGKMEWIYSHMPKWLHRKFLIGPQKQFCARPDTLLIDDADKNVEAFRESGGLALLVPRPWNKNRHLLQGDPETQRIVPSQYLKSVFDKFHRMKEESNEGQPSRERASADLGRFGLLGDQPEQLYDQVLAS